jgi:hypothetical protein
VLLDIMRRHYKARRWAEAERTAALVAPFVHPRLSCSSVTVKPSLQEMLMQATDEELAEFAEEADLADLANEAAGAPSPRPRLPPRAAGDSGHFRLRQFAE